jgi:hypothetical protein
MIPWMAGNGGFGLLIPFVFFNCSLSVALDCIASVSSFRYRYVHLRSIVGVYLVGYCLCHHGRYGIEHWKSIQSLFQKPPLRIVIPGIKW